MMSIGLVPRNNKLLITDQLFRVYSLLNPSTVFLHSQRTNLQNQFSDLVLETKHLVRAKVLTQAIHKNAFHTHQFINTLLFHCSPAVLKTAFCPSTHPSTQDIPFFPKHMF